MSFMTSLISLHRQLLILQDQQKLAIANNDHLEAELLSAAICRIKEVVKLVSPKPSSMTLH